jgi:hypothetical protein
MQQVVWTSTSVRGNDCSHIRHINAPDPAEPLGVSEEDVEMVILGGMEDDGCVPLPSNGPGDVCPS